MPWNVRLCLIVAALCLAAASPAFSEDSAPVPAPEKIGQLIEQLGDRNFTVRERAQSDLARMGIAAFDQLFGAMRSSDLEVARRAQYLIRSVEIEWSRPEFSDEVNAYLNRYGRLSTENRRSRIGELARLGTIDALSALCRISRYEVSEVLSKEAALAAAIQFQDADDGEKEQIGAVIAKRVEESPRIGPGWLRVFRISLNSPEEALVQWKEQVGNEIDLFTTRPTLTSQQVVLDLVRWQVDQLRAQNRQEDALAAMQDVIRISVNFAENELIDLTTWFLDRNSPSVVEELAKFHARNAPPVEGALVGGVFGDSPTLLYLLAESFLVQDKVDEAQKLADDALAIRSDSYDSHYLTARGLVERGCIRWARNEFSHVTDNLEITDSMSLRARREFGEMEHDLGRSDKAAEVMWPWVEHAEKEFGPDSPFNPETNETIGGILSRAYLFRATHAENQGDVVEAKKHLKKAMDYYEDEPDVLIAAYRIDKKDETWQAEAKRRIDHSIEFYKPYIEKFEKQYQFFKENSRGEEILGAQAGQMSAYCNQYSWLVSNTYGDFDHALRSSHLSLELQPDNGAYLDTLAHCYAAKQQWAEAEKHQRQAVQHLPHSGQIRRAYELFAAKCVENKIEIEPIEFPQSPDVHFPSEAAAGAK